MTFRTSRYVLVVVAVALSACASAYALSHPNFQSADDAIQTALGRIHAAQQVNGPNFGGHAGRAAQLLEQARAELATADEYHRGVRR